MVRVNCSARQTTGIWTTNTVFGLVVVRYGVLWEEGGWVDSSIAGSAIGHIWYRRANCQSPVQQIAKAMCM
jgi:hypothetical protein